ncbi:toluene tolerance protein [Ventosimonas gracilis]|uniref:Toluene tolerance protein n=1 Tax=Ventosimonas gracilis TaxID=1680762 RepID=A0A139SQC3_9GAMM|nr:ABC transporter substrate-binding protein [Ventosimonas gracilis]KXU36805.1 toluene tolerance protein [Ventosimonas gracilis]
MKCFTHFIIALTVALLSVLALAEDSTPQQIVQATTDRLLADLAANKEHYRQDNEAFYQALNGILGDVIDAEGIAKSVMTVKYSKDATTEQIHRFEENFKRSLLSFYGKALLEYNNNGIRVLPSAAPDAGRASVKMEVTGSNGTIYPVTYSMVEVNGAWRLRNVIINGINVGKLFRDQFSSSMQQNKGDLDKTINDWGQVVAKTASSGQIKP